MDDAVAQGVDLVVTCAAAQMRQTLRAAAEHPGPAYLNCSVSLSHSAVRGFYGRMYEAKFLLGALAASLAGHHKVGYVAESPVFSTVAEINAFAIGAQMVDPYSTVYLKWLSAKDLEIQWAGHAWQRCRRNACGWYRHHSRQRSGCANRSRSRIASRSFSTSHSNGPCPY